MPQLIFVSGASGGGKTETLATLPASVLRIEVDSVQHDAVRRAFPFVRRGREYDWFLWPRDPSTLDLVRLLEISLAGLHPTLAAHRGPLIAEGAILVNEWFRLAFQRTLARFGHSFGDADVSCLFLDPPADVLFRQIHQRAQERPNRRGEIAQYPDVASVERLRHLHLTQLAPGRWQFLPDPQALAARVQQLLA